MDCSWSRSPRGQIVFIVIIGAVMVISGTVNTVTAKWVLLCCCCFCCCHVHNQSLWGCGDYSYPLYYLMRTPNLGREKDSSINKARWTVSALRVCPSETIQSRLCLSTVAIFLPLALCKSESHWEDNYLLQKHVLNFMAVASDAWSVVTRHSQIKSSIYCGSPSW